MRSLGERPSSRDRSLLGPAHTLGGKADIRFSAGGSSAGQPDRVQQLAKLADLHDRSALTDAEFAAEKAKILNES
jgi:Short C-terminal domain